MKTYEYNGEQWYMDVRPFWVRLLQWLLRFGGWQQVVHNSKGYRYRYRARYAVGLALRARGHRTRLWAIFHSMCPISIFGHFITIQPFGFTISRRRGYLCVNWPHGNSDDTWQVYWSPNATPWAATWWLVGAPNDVQTLAMSTALRAEQRERERVTGG